MEAIQTGWFGVARNKLSAIRKARNFIQCFHKNEKLHFKTISVKEEGLAYPGMEILSSWKTWTVEFLIWS